MTPLIYFWQPIRDGLHTAYDGSEAILFGAIAEDSSVYRLQGGVCSGVAGFPSTGPAQEGAAPSVDSTDDHTVRQYL